MVDSMSGRMALAACIVTACTAVQLTADGQSTKKPQEHAWTVFLHRAGPIQVGMSLRQIRAVLGDPKASLGGNDPVVPLDECAYVESDAVPDAIGLMMAHGRVVRVDVFAPGIYTASGIQVGATEADVKKTYGGSIWVRPHPYLPESGNYLRYWALAPSDRAFGLVFETEDQRVTSFRAGTMEAISLIEGCA